MATANYPQGKVIVNGRAVDIPHLYMGAIASFTPPFTCGASGSGFDYVSIINQSGSDSNIVAEGQDSPLWFMYNYQLQEPWATIYNARDGVYHQVLVFSSGCYVSARRKSNSDEGRMDIAYYSAGGQLIMEETDWGLFGSWVRYGCFTVLENSNNQLLFERCLISYEPSVKFTLTSAGSNTATLGMVTEIDPGYTWKAWRVLQGNNGQYNAPLTALKDNSIGIIGGLNQGYISDFDYISDLADIVPYVRNMNYNSPVKIAYSGVNWLTAELQSDTGLLTNQVKCVFKFYIKNVSDVTPFYTLTELFFAGENDHHYLSFVYDNEQQAAAFLPVGYVKTNSTYYWGQVSPDDTATNMLWLWLQASGSPDPDPKPTRPYDSGTTDNGGGGGNPTPQDDIHTPNVPALGGMASGMFTVYCPTDTQLGNIAAWLWTDSFIDNVKKYFNNASDNIIAFYVLPLKPSSLPTKNFKVGNLENSSITDVEYLTTRFVSVDMGSIKVEKRWETYLDFSPFTKFSLYLPGVGVVALDSDDIMCPANLDGSMPSLLGSTISLTYVVDLMTGTLVVYVKINGQIRYQFPGKMGYNIPLTGQNYTAMGSGFITAMAGLATTIATGGTAAPFTAGATAAGIVNAMKPEVYRGGNLSGDASMLSLKTPLLIRSAPNKPAIDDQAAFTGAPSYKIDTLSNFSGFTQVVEAHIEDISCTSAERDEIMQLLKSGVII